MAEEIYVAVDLGASSGRVMAGVLAAGNFELREVHRFENGAVEVCGSLCWNWLALWKNIQLGLAKAKDDFGKSAIVSVGVDTWGVDFALMGNDKQILGAPRHYRDSHTKGILSEAFKLMPRKDIFGETGLQFMEFNTLFQMFAMKNNGSVALENTSHFLMMPDLFHWLLSGELTQEITDASTTQMINPENRQWSDAIISKFGLPRKIFGALSEPGTIVGGLQKGVVQSTGLTSTQVVLPPSHDTASAVAAVPFVEQSGSQDKWAFISSGTWSCMGIESKKAFLTEEAYQLDFTNEIGVDGTTRLLKNICGMWLIQQCAESWRRQGKDYAWDELVNLARDAEPLKSLIVPDDPCFVAPACMPTAINEFLVRTNQAPLSDVGATIRCCLESIALRYRQVLGWLEQITASSISIVHIIGGGSQNDLLNQFAANAMQRVVFAGPVEATSLGNVTCQMIANGRLNSTCDARNLIANSFALKSFEPVDASVWEDANARFEQLFQDN